MIDEKKSILRTLIHTARLGKVGARWAFVSALLVLVITLFVDWNFLQAGGVLSWPNVIFVMGAGILAIFFAWLGFTAHGNVYLLPEADGEFFSPLRAGRVILASIAMAFAIWLALIVVCLVLGGTEWVKIAFESWVLPMLAVVCVPFAYNAVRRNR